MSSFVIAHANECAKAGAAMLGNLATGLTGYTIYRVIIELKPDFIAFCGIGGTTTLVWGTFKVLGLIEPETIS